MFRAALAMLVLSVMIGVALSTTPPTADAHAEYGRSSPAKDSVIPESPLLIETWFTQELFKRAGANVLELSAEDGTPVVTAAPVLDDEDRTHLSVALTEPLPPGVYTVTWRTLSAVDGDTADGTFMFTIDPAAPPLEASPGAGADAGADEGEPGQSISGVASSDGGSTFPWWAVLATAAIMAAGAIGAWGLLAGTPESVE